MTVLSALGQPLRAEIELTSVSSDEAAQLNPKLASIDAFRTANIDFNPALYSLHFAVEQRSGGRQVISVTSVKPIDDPFIDMLLELGSNGSGHLIREYTFLLDPPAELRSGQTAQVSSTRPLAPTRNIQAPTSAPVTQEAQPPSDRPTQTARVPHAPQDRPIKSAVVPPAEQNAARQGDYHVKSGDSLSKIAGEVKPEGVSLDQMLVALYRANQRAFVGNNMNRLRAGQVLNVPDAATASAVGSSEARSIVVAQTADFNEYRNKLAGQVVNSEAQKSTEPRQSASGKITAKVEEKATAAAEAKDKLKLSKAGTTGEKGSKIAAGEEDKVAKEKEIAEANSRVKELEKNVSDLQKLLEIKNKNLADQQKATAATTAAAAATAAAKPAAAPPTVPTPVVAAVSASASASKTTQEVKPEVKPEIKPEVLASATPPSKPPKPKPRPIPPPERSWYDDLLGNPLVLGGAALLLLGAGAFGIYSSRRRKEKSFGDSILTDSSLKANSLFGSTGGQSVDTNNSVFNSNFAPSASQLDSNEVDPVAEADVYIAYGRDAQAEEILKEALRTQPDRNAVRVKLLEIYANRKDVRTFEVMASELYGMTKGEGEDWQQAASLGLSIDPKNPLYAAGKTAAATTGAAIGGHTLPLDEPDLDDLVAETHSRPSMESQNTLEESPYLGSTTLGGLEPDTVARLPESQPKSHDAPHDIGTSLDFDLDGMDAESVDMPAVTEHAAAPVEPVAHATPAAAENKMDFGNIDFDFINDAPGKPAEPAHLAQQAELAAHLAEEFPSLPAAHDEPHIPSLSEVAASALDEAPEHKHAAAPAPAAQALDFDLSGITLELNPADKPSSAAKPADDHAFDLHVPEIPGELHAPELHASDMHAPELHVPEIHQPEIHAPELHLPDLHVPEAHVPEIHAPELHVHESHVEAPALAARHEPTLDKKFDTMPQHAESEVALDTGIDHEYSNSAEMATKFDLAVAYQEIGDKEGARELLEEVIQGGVSEHTEKAKALLAKLG